MKKWTIKLIMAAMVLTALSCNKENKSTTGEPEMTQQQDTLNSTGRDASAAGKEFDINSIPVSDKELGAFPFFSLPDGLAEQNKPIQRKFDRLFFPLNGIMTPVEGKLWKSNIVVKPGTSDEWSLPYFEKSYDEAIKAAGGVKVFDGQISNEEYDRYKSQAAYLGEDGSIGYTDQNIKVYVIRRADGGDVYIQLTGNTAGGYLNILQKEPFKQTITMLKSDEIQKELTEKGKAVLHINFDVDKATLKTDGKEAVNEIAKVLTADKSLKIAVNGYTDNTGDEKHNLELSKQRALTVKNELISKGIASNRLTSEGFGPKNPITQNTSEEGKAQNRRVELVKQS